MTLDNFRSIGDLTAEILAGLAVSTSGNVIDLAERRARIEGRIGGNHATDPLSSVRLPQSGQNVPPVLHGQWSR